MNLNTDRNGGCEMKKKVIIKLIFLKIFQKFFFENLRNSIRGAINSNIIFVKWSQSSETKNNFGDALNPWLIRKLTGMEIINASKSFNFRNKPVYSIVGSVLDRSRFDNMIVWGSGFKSKDSKVKIKPAKVLAVRGPLTRDNLIEQGIECPSVYGDPALLLPQIYNPDIPKKYKIGIIPHYVDKKTQLLKSLTNTSDVSFKIIDIEDDIESFIDNVLSCELIVSSSLHGLIVADAYGIQSLYIRFSDKVSGGNFKFKDYMLSVGRTDYEPYIVKENSTLQDLMIHFSEYNLDIDLAKLLDRFPFKQLELS